MIVADTGAVVARIDADDLHHDVLRIAFERDPDGWVLPWAILPEVDHFVSSRLGSATARAFRKDLAEGAFVVEWGLDGDVLRAVELDARYVDLRLGLVDSVVMAVAERLEARAIATLDLLDFVRSSSPPLWSSGRGTSEGCSPAACYRWGCICLTSCRFSIRARRTGPSST